jgi:hypothetical protein
VVHTGYLVSLRVVKCRRLRWGERRNAYRIFVGKPFVKCPVGRPRMRMVDNIV